MTRSTAFLAGLVICSLACPGRAEDWPSWRGPLGNGISKETRLPTAWSDKNNIAWKLPMPGKAGSTPVVWKDRIFLTSSEGNDLVMLCVSTQGKELWKKKIAKAVRLVIKYDEANEASASPCTDGKHVYAFVGSGHLACFDFQGEEIWKANIQERYGKFNIEHGIHATPLLHEDRLYLNLLHTGGQLVLALDKTSGKEVWKIDRTSDAVGESREAYASPCLWSGGKETALIVLGSDYTTAHSLKDGKELWRLGDLNPKAKYSAALRIIASPVPAPDMLLVPTARGGLVVAVKPGAQGAIKAGSPFELWRTAKGSPDVPSPLVHDGLVYLMRENGVLIVLDAATGKELHQERLHDSRYRASPVLADGKIYTCARDGTFHVIKPGRKPEILATNQLADVFTASPAVSGGRIYLRGFGALYALEEKKAGQEKKSDTSGLRQGARQVAEKVRVITLGDSITRGVRPGVKAEETFAAVLEQLLAKNGVQAEVVNIGIGGERTDQALARLAKDVLARKPAVVTIMYGHNDSHVPDGKKAPMLSLAEYQANLMRLVMELRKHGIKPVLLTPPCYAKQATPNGLGEHHNLRLGQCAEACLLVARRTQTPVVDLFQSWSAAEAKGQNLAEWTTDLYHPNPAGARHIAESILPAVLKALKLAEPTPKDSVALHQYKDSGEVVVSVNQRPFATLVHKGGKTTRPYFTDVFAPGGQRVTRHYPPVPGKDLTDHEHMHPGLWLAFGDINGQDTWRNQAPVKTIRSFLDPAKGKVMMDYAYFKKSGEPLAQATDEYTIIPKSEGHWLLWDSRFQPAKEALVFGDQEEMGLGIRLATELSGQKGGRIVDAEGRRGEKAVWSKSSAWCEYSGLVDGRRVGVVVYPHPDNFRPSWWHVREYGLLTANPFGRQAFTKGEKSRVVVEPGQTLRLRFTLLYFSASGDESPAALAGKAIPAF